MPPFTPKKYSRRLKRLSLGMPPRASPSPSTLSVRLSFHYILITSCVMCYAWSVLLLVFLFSFLQLFITSRNSAFFMWERNTLHFYLEHNIEFSCLSLLCVFFVFQQLLSCLAFSFHAYLFKELLLSWLLELSILSRLFFLGEFASVGLIDMSMMKMLHA